jgi:hypothetical protein
VSPTIEKLSVFITPCEKPAAIHIAISRAVRVTTS